MGKQLHEETEQTFKIENEEPKTSLGKMIYDELGQDTLKRVKFVNQISDFEDFEYNYSNLFEKIENDFVDFDRYFYPVVDLHIDAEEEKKEITAVVEQF